MKIYVSGTFTAQERLRERAHQLAKMGHYVRGSWLAEVNKPEYLTQLEWDRTLALTDIAEVYAADCIILDLDGASTSGGRYVEWGVACAPGSSKLKWIVSNEPHHGVFNALADARFIHWDDLVVHLQDNYGSSQAPGG